MKLISIQSILNQPSVSQESHLRRPIHHSSHVALKHRRTLSHLCVTAIGATSAIRMSWQPLDNTYGPRTLHSPRYQQKRWYALMRRAWGLSRILKCPPSHVKQESSAHRTVGGLSIKKPNLWSSEPASAHSMLAMVALWSGDFKLYSDTTSITPCQSSNYAHSNVCVNTLGDFLLGEKWRLWRNVFASKLCFKFGKNFTETFQMLQQVYGGLFEPYAMSRVVSAFQIGPNVHRRRPQIWTAFHVNGQRSRWESVCCDSLTSSPNCTWSCRRSRNL